MGPSGAVRAFDREPGGCPALRALIGAAGARVQLPETPDADTTALAIKRNLSCMATLPWNQDHTGKHDRLHQAASQHRHIRTSKRARALVLTTPAHASNRSEQA